MLLLLKLYELQMEKEGQIYIFKQISVAVQRGPNAAFVLGCAGLDLDACVYIYWTVCLELNLLSIIHMPVFKLQVENNIIINHRHLYFWLIGTYVHKFPTCNWYACLVCCVHEIRVNIFYRTDGGSLLNSCFLAGFFSSYSTKDCCSTLIGRIYYKI